MKCLFPDCTIDKILCRGVCRKHYGLMSKAVKGNKKTWEDFEKYGYCKRVRSNQTDNSRHFYKILEKMMPIRK